jgi:hypothetical protein
MTTPQISSLVLAILSALLSISATYLMFQQGMTLAQFMGYASPKLIAEVEAQNAKRLRVQKISLALLLAASVLACASALVSALI